MLTNDRNFYRSFFRTMLILVLQKVVVHAVNLLDNMMIGSYSELALSGVAAANQVQFVYTQLVMGAENALVAICSQYWGRRATGQIKQLIKGGMLLGVAAALLVFGIMSFFPSQMLGVFTNNPQIVEAGCRYVKIIRFSYLCFAVSSIVLAGLRSVEVTKVALLASIEALVINLLLNYMLINGNWGAPRLGEVGAAIGTLTARVVEMVTVLAYAFLRDKKLNFTPRDLLSADWQMVGDYLKTVPYYALTAVMFGLSTALQSVVLGNMSDSAIAANSASNALFQLVKVAAAGSAGAAGVYIGKAIGTGDKELVRSYARTMQVIFLGVGAASSLLLFLLRVPVLSLYSMSEQTRVMANNFLLILCVTGFGTAYQMPVITGIIRGGGDSRFVFVNDLISIWGIVLPLSFLGAFVFNWSPEVVLFCLNSDQLFKCAAAFIKVNRFNWIKKLTR